MAPLRSLGNIRSAFDDFYARTGKDAVSPAPTSYEATGGNAVSSPGNGYKYHLFTSPGNFVVSGRPGSVEYLVVASGGSGGSRHGSGGGAGGLRTNVSGNPKAGPALTVGPGSYAVVVAPGIPAFTAGGGGQPVSGPSANDGNQGDPASIAFPSPIAATGGGAGVQSPGPSPAIDGGSGGGRHDSAAHPDSPGNAGGYSPPEGNPGGVGGGPNAGGPGGNGHPIPAFASPIVGPMLTTAGVQSPYVTAFNSAVGPTGLYAGGGGGGQWSSPGGPSGGGGGGAGGPGNNSTSDPSGGLGGPGGGGAGGRGPDTPATVGLRHTGSGGGGAGGTGDSGEGGAGIVIIRYEFP